MGSGPYASNRDLPDGLWPTTAVGLSNKSITDREIGKRGFCSAQGVPGRFRAVSLWFLRFAKVACGQIRGQLAQHLPAQLIPRFQPLRSPPPPEQHPQPAHGQQGQRGGLGCDVPGADGVLAAPEVRGRMLRIADGGRRVRGHPGSPGQERSANEYGEQDEMQVRGSCRAVLRRIGFNRQV